MEPHGTAPPYLSTEPWRPASFYLSAGAGPSIQAKRQALWEGGQLKALRTDMCLRVRGTSYSHSVRWRERIPPATLARFTPPCLLPALPPPILPCPKLNLKGRRQVWESQSTGG